MNRLAVVVLFSLMVPTQAKALTGTELYTICSSSDTNAELSCISYIRGLMDGLYLADHMAATGARYCRPDNFSVPQAKLVIEKYMKDHPEDLHQAAGAIASLALSRLSLQKAKLGHYRAADRLAPFRLADRGRSVPGCKRHGDRRVQPVREFGSKPKLPPQLYAASGSRMIH